MNRIRNAVLAMILLLSHVQLYVAAKEMPQGAAMPDLQNTTANRQNYATWSSPMTSYLVDTPDGYMAVAYDSSGMYALYYDTSYILHKTVEIEAELPLFGGFHATDGNYYIVTGQNNPEEQADVECYRITKYDKSWNRISSVGLYDCNTYIPFDAGSCRMDDAGNYLLIRTCHEMYKSSDGYHHQANVTMQVDTDKMEITDAFYNVAYIGVGYVSHSFNQFLLAEDDHIVAVDHGDAYPRSAVLFRYNNTISSGRFTGYGKYVDLMKFAGGTGNNTTGASLGGFASTSTHYLVAGNATHQEDVSQRTRNIWVSAADKSDITSNHVYWLTSQAEDGANHLTTPHLVDLGDDTCMVLWSDLANPIDTIAQEANVYFAIVNHDGTIKESARTVKGVLSDCVPIVKDGKVVWYVREKNYITFYEIDLAAKALSKHQAKTEDWKDVEQVSVIPDSFDMCVGQSFLPEIKLIPEDATDTRTVTSVSDETVLQKNWSGNYYAASEGEATIRVDTPSGKYGTCQVKVYPKIESFYYYSLKKTMYEKDTQVFDIIVEPESLAAIKRYSSSDESILTVSQEGLVTAVSPGTATVTCSIGTRSATQTITVVKLVDEDIAILPEELSLEEGKATSLEVKITPEDATYKDYTLSSSDESVVTVNNYGYVRAVGIGKAVITATSHHGKTATCSVTVTEKVVPATSISLNKTSLALTEGNSETLTATILPMNTTDKTVAWSSSDAGVATVDNNGKVTAVKAGTATITAKTHNDLTATCSVTVKAKDIPATGISLNKTSLSLVEGGSETLTATIKPDNVTNKKVTWSSSDTSIATVDKNGKVTAIKEGTATITAKTSNKKTATCSVSVTKKTIEATGVTLNKTSLSLVEGSSETLVATISPSDATDKTITWSSSDTGIATVDNSGKVTAVKAGTATITAETSNGKTATCSVAVTQKIIEATGITLNKTSLSLVEGSSETLVATISPSDATDKAITWSSSNTGIATVDNSGKVTAVKAGTAAITAKTSNGKSAVCEVTVVASDPAACRIFGFCQYKGKFYWYEGGKRQAMPGDPKNIWDTTYNLERGREIFDPESDGWYWLDTVFDGAKAEGKEVWVPYIYQDEDGWTNDSKRSIAHESDKGMGEYVYKCMREKSGKWVRYDENGKMLKGWITINGELAKIYPAQKGNTYYYDTRTGLMAKGWINIEGKLYHFDEITGVLKN